MKRQELEHLIRAAAAITNEYEIVVIGSQSILGSLPDAPDFLLRSMEADMYPLRRPDFAHGATEDAADHSVDFRRRPSLSSPSWILAWPW